MSGYFIQPHRDRLRWRGFNQSEKLGHFVAKKLEIPLINPLLIRHMKRVTQADMQKREDRIKNARGLFSVSPRINLSTHQHILLFDDVWATGAMMVKPRPF